VALLYLWSADHWVLPPLSEHDGDYQHLDATDPEPPDGTTVREAQSWLQAIAAARQEADDWDHPDFDWRLLARKMESLARRGLAGES